MDKPSSAPLYFTVLVLLLLAANFFTMGIPGSLLFGIGNSLSLALLSEDTLGKLQGDSYWPIALAYGTIWPISLPIIYYICTKIFQNETTSLTVFFIALVPYTIILSMYFRISNAI